MSDTDTPTPPARPSRKRADRSISQLLTAVQVALDNALADPDLQSALLAYGYTSERLNEGKGLYESVLAHQRQQQTGQGAQISASTAFRSSWAAAHATYARLFKVARVALKDHEGDLLLLGLNGKRKQSFAAWKEQSLQFYTNALANPHVLARLQTFGITEARLREGLQQVSAAESTNAAKKLDKGSAQQATATRNLALRELRRWHSDFIIVARVAFQDRPQQMEKLGVIARSRV